MAFIDDDLRPYSLCLGGNVFGWTADEGQSRDVLDAYAEAGGNFIDTADSYAMWAPGNSGGESEAIIGSWMQARGNRAQMIIATKVGQHPDAPGLSARSIQRGVEASLRRLQTDWIDLYWAHEDDPQTPFTESLDAFQELIESGKIRYLGVSNFSAPRLAQALHVAGSGGAARIVAIQPKYNLVERADYEKELAPLAAARNLACMPYSGLANGFLTGKYRRGHPRSTASGPEPRTPSPTRGAKRCWRLSPVLQSAITAPSRRSRSRGWRPSQRSPLQSRARGPWSSSATCCRWRASGSHRRISQSWTRRLEPDELSATVFVAKP
jgi:aryl-alcohol dehydrogenase-like predicted oxidoreductase